MHFYRRGKEWQLCTLVKFEVRYKLWESLISNHDSKCNMLPHAAVCLRFGGTRAYQCEESRGGLEGIPECSAAASWRVKSPQHQSHQWPQLPQHSKMKLTGVRLKFWEVEVPLKVFCALKTVAEGPVIAETEPR